MLKPFTDWFRRGGRRRREFDPAGSMMAFAGLGAEGGAAAVRTSLPGVDRALVGVVLALILLGTVMVYSASIALADSPRYNVAPTHFLVRHVLSLGIAFCVAVVAFQVPMATWQRLAPVLFVGTMA
ncbi:MAG TPA: FtsW/RodA/SpoVE family cell cycle protein, partial [Burkholderiaceae bacterium]|nr:FtsW/RodA/SpoVE family cell cycle protein [Burkholderiaceae bacterium]